jgi:hypothetical protein
LIETKQSGKKVAACCYYCCIVAWVLLFSWKCQEMEGPFQFGDYFGKQESDSRLYGGMKMRMGMYILL